jgi:hypothetical protein
MVNAQNGHLGVLPPPRHPPELPTRPPSKPPMPPPLKTVPSASRPSAAPASAATPARSSVAPVSQPPRPSGIRSAPPPLPSRPVGGEDTRDMVRAEVQEALAPLRDRLDELERSMLETIVRVASKSSEASASSPTLDPDPDPHEIRSGLLSWVRRAVSSWPASGKPSR